MPGLASMQVLGRSRAAELSCVDGSGCAITQQTDCPLQTKVPRLGYTPIFGRIPG